jgi:hypothetical protein
MGLPPIEPSEMARFMEAAFEDHAEAVRWVKAHHQDFGIDRHARMTFESERRLRGSRAMLAVP